MTIWGWERGVPTTAQPVPELPSGVFSAHNHGRWEAVLHLSDSHPYLFYLRPICYVLLIQWFQLSLCLSKCKWALWRLKQLLGWQQMGHRHMDTARKRHQGGMSPKEHFHPLPKCFFQEVVCFYPRFSGPVTRWYGLYPWGGWKEEYPSSPWGLAIHLQVSSEDEPGREVFKLAGLNKDDVFLSYLHQKIPRFFLAFRLSSPSDKSQLRGGSRSTFSNQQGGFKMPWTFEALCNYIFISSYIQVLGGEGNFNSWRT